jgi:hypothetical protein
MCQISEKLLPNQFRLDNWLCRAPKGNISAAAVWRSISRLWLYMHMQV